MPAGGNGAESEAERYSEFEQSLCQGDQIFRIHWFHCRLPTPIFFPARLQGRWRVAWERMRIYTQHCGLVWYPQHLSKKNLEGSNLHSLAVRRKEGSMETQGRKELSQRCWVEAPSAKLSNITSQYRSLWVTSGSSRSSWDKSTATSSKVTLPYRDGVCSVPEQPLSPEQLVPQTSTPCPSSSTAPALRILPGPEATGANERVTGRKARSLQMEKIDCSVKHFFSLLSSRRKQYKC